MEDGSKEYNSIIYMEIKTTLLTSLKRSVTGAFYIFNNQILFIQSVLLLINIPVKAIETN